MTHYSGKEGRLRRATALAATIRFKHRPRGKGGGVERPVDDPRERVTIPAAADQARLDEQRIRRDERRRQQRQGRRSEALE